MFRCSCERPEFMLQCSYFHCGSNNYDDERERAQDFLDRYSTGSTSHTCYVSSDEAGVALLKLPDVSAFGALLAFSLILLIASAVIFTTTCLVFRERTPATNDDVTQLVNGDAKGEATTSAQKRPETQSGVKFEIREGFA